MVADKELKSSIDALTKAVSVNNELMPKMVQDVNAMKFKVGILWSILCVTCGVTLVGFLGWLGLLLSKGW